MAKTYHRIQDDESKALELSSVLVLAEADRLDASDGREDRFDGLLGVVTHQAFDEQSLAFGLSIGTLLLCSRVGNEYRQAETRFQFGSMKLERFLRSFLAHQQKHRGRRTGESNVK